MTITYNTATHPTGTLAPISWVTKLFHAPPWSNLASNRGETFLEDPFNTFPDKYFFQSFLINSLAGVFEVESSFISLLNKFIKSYFFRE